MSRAPILKVGGTLRLEELYIRRPEDDIAFEVLAEREYCSILTSRQMGKSSLMVRLMTRLQDEKNAQIASVDIAGDLGKPKDAETWYIGFLEKIALDLDLDDDIRVWWKEKAKGTNNERLLAFFRDIVGKAFEEPVYIFVDEIDASLKLDYSDDFFVAIRSMYNQRQMVEAYRRLTFCILGVASPGELIKDRRTTPYNIGRTVELRDFDPAEDDLGPLFTAMSESGADGEALARMVLAWTGGHPFLTLALCDAVRRSGARTKADVDGLVDVLVPADEAGPKKAADNSTLGAAANGIKGHFDMIHTFLGTRLQHEAAAFRLYDRLLRGKSEPFRATPPELELLLSGIVKRGANDALVVRNRIYARHFGHAWVAQTKAMRNAAWTRWLSVAVGVLVVGMIGGAFYYIRQTNERRLKEATEVATWSSQLEPNIADVLSAPDEQAARAALGVLCKHLHDAPSGAETLPREKVVATWKEFWEKRATKLEQMAARELALNEVEKALVFAALAAAKRGEELDTKWEERYRDIKGSSIIATFRLHSGRVDRARFLGPDRLVSLGVDGTVRLLDPIAGKELDNRSNAGLRPLIDTCSDGSCILVGAMVQNRLIGELLGIENGKLTVLGKFTDESRRPNAIVLGRAKGTDGVGRWVAIGDDSGKVFVGRVPSGGDQPAALEERKTFTFKDTRKNLASPVYALQWIVDEQLLVAGTLNGASSLQSGAATPTSISEGSTLDVRVSQDGKRALVSQDRLAAMYSLADGRSAKPIRYPADGIVLRSAFSRDEQRVASAIRGYGNEDKGTLVIWRSTDGKLELEMNLAHLPTDVDWVKTASGEDLVVYAYGYRVAGQDGAVRVLRRREETSEKLPRGVDLWKDWQKKFGYTVDENESLVRLGPEGPKETTGYSAADVPEGCELNRE